MGTFEWLELENVSGEIANSQSRLAAARSTQNHGLVRLLERKLAEAGERRARLLFDITAKLTGSPSASVYVDDPIVAEVQEKAAELERRAAQQVEQTVASEPACPDPAARVDGMEGAAVVWNQLTPGDLDRAKQELDRRRAEILARHAEELKSLDTDQAEIDTIEQAIAAFARKFNVAGAEVVRFDDERGSRSQTRG